MQFHLDLQDTGDCKVIKAAGAYVMPGGIDPHTHLEMPFMGTTAVDDFFTCALHDLHEAPIHCFNGSCDSARSSGAWYMNSDVCSRSLCVQGS